MLGIAFYFLIMDFRYRTSPGKVYFLTITVVGWIDLFSRKNHKLTVIDSLKYCQEHKGLEIYGWCLMSSHLHMIASCKDDSKNISDIVRDFKRFTSIKLANAVGEEPESRREWMLNKFAYEASRTTKIKNYKVWPDGNHPEELYSSTFTQQKLNYLHNNPVKELIVERPEEYLFSSARNYADMKGLLEVQILNRGLDRAY